MFLDEIHRFSTAQQDSLLEGVETGKVILIAATTENPAFQINKPLLSRLQVFRLDTLPESELSILLDRVLESEFPGRKIEDSAKQILFRKTAGDARSLLTSLESLLLLIPEDQVVKERLKITDTHMMHPMDLFWRIISRK